MQKQEKKKKKRREKGKKKKGIVRLTFKKKFFCIKNFVKNLQCNLINLLVSNDLLFSQLINVIFGK